MVCIRRHELHRPDIHKVWPIQRRLQLRCGALGARHKEAAKDGENSLYIDFIKLCKDEGNGRKLYDEEILSGDDARSHHHMECLDMISKLAVQCLKEYLDDRPTMAEVVEKLKRVKAIATGGSCSVTG